MKVERLEFLAPDDGLPEGGAVDFAPVQDAEDYEVVVSDDPLEGEGRTEEQERDRMSRDEIMRMIEEQKAAIAGAQSRGEEITALREGLADLGKSLKQTPAQGPAPAEFNEEEYKKKFNEDFYNDPYQFMTDFAMKKLGPEFQRLAARQEEMLKRDLRRDPERADTLEKYRDEIEEEYQRIPAYERYQNPYMYEQAHDRVVARHINEIIQARVSAALEEAKMQTQTQEPAQAPRTGGFSETGGATSAARAPAGAGSGGKQRVRLSTREAKWADKKGFTERKAVEVLQRNPELRKVING